MSVSKTRVLGLASSAVLLAATVFLLLRLQSVIDWWKLRDYTPPQAIEQLATNAGMSDEGRRLFYVHYPELLINKQNFRDKCIFEEFSIVLGCYISHDRIYIFDISDERLVGAEEVTAAHEMLHAAYDRLSLSERNELDVQLTAVLEKVTDKRILKTIQSYRDTDPAVVPNELHSIFGTELRTLTPELEQYYGQYFSDRTKIVALSEQYASEFTKRVEQIEAYDRQLEQKNGIITTLNATLGEQGAVLEQEQRRLQTLRSNPELFNAEVDGFNAKVTQYNRTIEQIQQLTKEYNELVDIRNQIAVEERELIEAIDTSLQPISN